jgi:hypothetical protein
MLGLLKRSQPPLAAANDAVLTALATPGGRGQVDLIGNLRSQATALGQKGAAVRGAIDDTD